MYYNCNIISRYVDSNQSRFVKVYLRSDQSQNGHEPEGGKEDDGHHCQKEEDIIQALWIQEEHLLQHQKDRSPAAATTESLSTCHTIGTAIAFTVLIFHYSKHLYLSKEG